MKEARPRRSSGQRKDKRRLYSDDTLYLKSVDSEDFMMEDEQVCSEAIVHQHKLHKPKDTV